MTPSLIVALLLIAAVVAAIARLVLWQRQAATPASPQRLMLLIALQPLWAGLLYPSLFPPPVAIEAGTLIVATRNAKGIEGLAGDHRIALPEAPVLGIERVPDLATALRKYPDVARLRIVGDGLEARDREAVRGRALSFDANPLPKGLVRLNPPAQVAPGGAFTVSGQVNGVSGSVELIDPAGQRIDAAPLSKAGEFTLGGTVRASGPATFTLRILGDLRQTLQQVDVPVWTSEAAHPRVLLLAGAPGPDVKYLRRWAEDAGPTIHTQFSLGGGININDAPVPVNAAALRDLDIVIVDERSWTALGEGERRALADAVQAGLGLLLRVTGPVPDATRRDWAALGLNISPAGGQSLTLPPQAVDDDAALARRGAGSAEAPSVLNSGNQSQTLTPIVRVSAGDGAPLLQEAGGQALGLWRLQGRGRIGVLSVPDAYRLVLTGEGDRYGEIWSGILAPLVRPVNGLPTIDGVARQSERVTLCGMGGNPSVVAPDGSVTTLILDPARGENRCAGYWPAQSGWHLLRQDDQPAWPFFVNGGAGMSSIWAAETREATQKLVSNNTSLSAAKTANGPVQRGASWPWFLGWLVISGLLWWLERARRGRPNR